MKTAILVMALTGLALSCRAQWIDMPIASVVTNSDLIVVATLTDVRRQETNMVSGTVAVVRCQGTLQVEEVLKGAVVTTAILEWCFSIPPLEEFDYARLASKKFLWLLKWSGTNTYGVNIQRIQSVDNKDEIKKDISILYATPCCAQTNMVGIWSCVETNRYGASAHRHVDETYVTTTHFQFGTSATITVTATTPYAKLRPIPLNTTHVGTYTIRGNRLTITAESHPGHRARMPGLDDSYLLGWDGQVLILTNEATGKVRHLVREELTKPFVGVDGKPAPQR